MKRYLSYGAGVNSTALMIILDEQGIEFETIFVNHETDMPETYEYLKYIKQQGYKINDITPNFQGYSSLYQYCFDKKFLPSIFLRWCTYRFKLEPIWKYVEVPCIMYIGISSDEKKRAFKSYHTTKKTKQITLERPLIDMNIDRDKCIDIIKDHGLKIPPRSGCFMCPFMSKTKVLDLYHNHRDLYDKIRALEKERGNEHYLLKKPIQCYVAENTPKLEEFENEDPVN